MKREGDDWIIHGLYVDDMQHCSFSQRLKNELMTLYQRDFTVTGGETMETLDCKLDTIPTVFIFT